jgi:DNA-binding CsgD family transcriptional regulator
MSDESLRMRTEPDECGGLSAAGTRSGHEGVSSFAARALVRPTGRANREAPHPPQFRRSALCESAFAILEKFNRGVLLLDADGVVQYMNRTARAMLNRGHGLSMRNRRLAFATADATAALDACLHGGEGNLLLRVGGPNHAHRPYSVLVTPLEGPEASAGFCVFIHEPLGRQRPVPVQVLKELYGLTAAEARLVNSLYVGQSLQSAAATGGISLNTAKTVLKHVFVKCEVSSQAELLQLLALGPRVA